MQISFFKNTCYSFVEYIGRISVSVLEELGYLFALLTESIYWLIMGKKQKQAVRLPTVFHELITIGITAIPIVIILNLAIGIMLAIQGIETLKIFGAESQVVLGIALSVTREFSPLIISILIAGRSGSSITARIGTMMESQEIDALRVMGINPVRYLLSPILIAMLIALPSLVILGDIAGLLGGALYSAMELNMTIFAYFERTLDFLTVDDIRQGLIKSLVFACIIALVSAVNGFQVRGGAQGVGRATTRSVVVSISAIVLADMIFTYFLNR